MNMWTAGKTAFPLGKKTYIMGILNVTPDSFSDGGKYFGVEQALAHAEEMEQYGAALLDLGAQSTRPGFQKISAKEEWMRLEPVLTALRVRTNLPLSVDTFYPEVAERALAAGADIINDVTGFQDPEMRKIAAKSDCGCIVMHNGELHDSDNGGDDVLERVRCFFGRMLELLAEDGISRERICVDPGIGFGKSYEENLALLANVDRVKPEGCAFLMAASRKRVIGAPCGNPPFEERLAGTVAAHTIAQWMGADFLRVHDVREAVQAALVADVVKAQRRDG